MITSNEDDFKTRAHEFLKFSPCFVWLYPYSILNTFYHTTQYAHLPTDTVLKRAFKSGNLALNVTKPVFGDNVYADILADNYGSNAVLMSVRTFLKLLMSMVVKVYEDNIIQCSG
jgi:hypothetical protein